MPLRTWGMWLDKEGTCFASSLMREPLLAISSAAHGSIFHWELPRLADNLAAWEAARWTAAGCPKGEVSRERDSSINRPSKNLSEGDLWSITTNSHHLPTTQAMGSEAEVVEAHGCQPCY
jgi:hypothetical protein